VNKYGRFARKLAVPAGWYALHVIVALIVIISVELSFGPYLGLVEYDYTFWYILAALYFFGRTGFKGYELWVAESNTSHEVPE
jgi:hypothetical protein